MIKWILGGVFTLFIIIYFMSFQYGKLYYIDISTNKNVTVVNETDISTINFQFFDPYNNLYLFKSAEYNIDIQAYLTSAPTLELSAKDKNGDPLSLKKDKYLIDINCGGLFEDVDFHNNPVLIVSAGYCFKENLDEVDFGLFSFDIYNSNDEHIGTETLRFKIKRNGFYMYPFNGI